MRLWRRRGGQHGIRTAIRCIKAECLFIIVDDLDCRIRCYGDPVAKTPSTDRLAVRGVRFDRAYCQFLLCNSSRSSVLSGRYLTSTGVLDNDNLLVLEEGQYTMPRYFERHGYAGAEFGKIFQGINQALRKGESKLKKGAAASWFTPEERARQQGENPAYWDQVHSPYRNLRLSNPGQHAWANEFGFFPEGEKGQAWHIVEQMRQSLAKMTAEGRPFFLAVGFRKPYVPLT